MLEPDRRHLRNLMAEQAVKALPPIPSSAAWLKPYCYQEWDRWPYTAPLTAHGYTWALTAGILQRMPVNPDVPVYEPGCGHENEYLAEILQRRTHRGRELVSMWSHSFREVAMRRTQLPVGGVHLSSSSIELINRLPNLRVETDPHPFEEQNLLSFHFDGGDGIVMRLPRPLPKIKPLGNDHEEPF